MTYYVRKGTTDLAIQKKIQKGSKWRYQKQTYSFYSLSTKYIYVQIAAKSFDYGKQTIYTDKLQTVELYFT